MYLDFLVPKALVMNMDCLRRHSIPRQTSQLEPPYVAPSDLSAGLLKKLELLKSRYPEKLRPKTILVIYTSLALPELVEEAKAKNVWVLKATQDYYKPDFAKMLGRF